MGSEVTPGDVFRLSLVSNVLAKQSSGTVADLAEKAAAAIPERMAQLGLADWSVAWGPMVFKDKDVKAGGPDLVAYVANNADTYVVAIAGTHKDSQRALTIYDIRIQYSVDFEAWRNQNGAVKSPPNIVENANPNAANVAKGTALGVYDLARTRTVLGPSSGTDIVTYLQTLKPGSKLIYTGHSLGGALSPTLALGLLNELKNINPEDVSTFPTAGPTPGDAKFVSLFTDAFPEGGGFNQNVINTRDPVTFAWNIDDTNYPERCLQYLRKVFGPVPLIGQLSVALYALQTNAERAKNKYGMTYAFLPSTSFTGTNELPHKKPPKNKDEYLDNALVAHIKDYETEFNIPEGKLGDIEVAFPFPVDPESVEYYGESAFDDDGNYLGPKDVDSTDE